MKKNISEDLPARKFPQASLSKGGGDRDREGGESKTPEKKVRQAVYDIKYRARRENIPLRAAYSQYMQNSAMSEQEKSEVRKKLFGDIGSGSPVGSSDKPKKFVDAFKKPGMQAEDFNNYMKESASSAVSNALYKVFVEKESEDIGEEYIEELKKEFMKKEISRVDRDAGKTRYKIRVTDKSGVTYVRYATREKINSLRANPNIREVEMTEYGEPYEGEKNKGVQTAAAKSGKDYDGDGKVESPAKEYRGAVHNEIQRKKGGNPDGQDTSSVKEQFLGELNDENTIDVKSKKKPKNKIVVHHNKDKEGMNESSYSKFLGLLNEREMTKGEVTKEKKLKTKYDPSDMKASMIKQYGEEKGMQVYFATIRKQAMKEESCGSDNGSNVDPRSIPTKVNLIKTRLRAAGARNPIVMVSNDNDVKEGAGLSVGISRAVGSLLSNPRTSAEQGAKNFQKNVADPIGNVVKGAARAIVQPANMSDKAQKERMGKYRPEEVEFEGELVDESRLGDRAKEIENDEAKKGGLRRTRSNREKIAGQIGRSQNVDPEGDLGRQKAPKDTGLHKGATRSSSEDEDDEKPKRRKRDDNPALTAGERNPNLR